MSILVTGGCGYIGSHVVRQLSEAGYEPIVYDDLSTGFAESLLNGETLVTGSLSERERVESALRSHSCDTVMHFAASIVAPESVTAPLKYYRNNTCNTLNLLQACVTCGVQRFIFSSTAAVYGLPGGGMASEACPTLPINPYGTSKLMSEWMLRDTAATHGMRYMILRYFNVAGADPQARMGQRTAEATHLIKVACQAALGVRKHVSIFGTDYPTPDGTGVRDYIHVEDLAAAHLAALQHLALGGESDVCNIGYGSGSSVLEVIDMVRQVSGRSFPVLAAPRRPGDPAVLVAGAGRIRERLSWTPKHASLQAIVTDAWRWEQKLFSERLLPAGEEERQRA